jgi:hypothetical protein
VKTRFTLSMLISFAMICSCQKQDSTAEQQLAQQKAKLDAREKALNERVNALDERMNVLSGRVNALADQQKAMGNVRTIPTDPQIQISDPAQVQAERDAAIQQLSAEIRARIPDETKMKADGGMKDRLGWNNYRAKGSVSWTFLMGRYSLRQRPLRELHLLR